MDDDEDWQSEAFLTELFRVHDEAVASRNPKPTPAPAPASAPVPIAVHDPFAAAPISWLPAASASASYPSPVLRFSPPRELTQRPPIPPPPSAAGDGDALAMVSRGFSPPRELSQRPPLTPPPAAAGDGDALAMVTRGFSPPRELSQRSAAEESDCAIVRVLGPAGGDRFMGTGGSVAAKRDREAREEVERLKRELNRVSKQMNDLKNECKELKKDRTKKDLQIKAKEAEIQNLKKANVGSAGTVVCGVGMDIDQSVHVLANGASHAAGFWPSTRTDKPNGKVKEAHSLREDLCFKQRHQADLPEASELNHHTMIDNTTSASGGVNLEENPHLEPIGMKCKEIKAIGVQTDISWNTEPLDCKKVLVERISSNLRAIWGMPTNSLLGRNLISKTIVSCSEEILALVQCSRLTDKCGTSPEASSSMNEAIFQLYDIFVKMNSEKIPIQTFLEALLNLCSFENVAIVGRTLRILHKILQHLLNCGTRSNERNNVSVEPYDNTNAENSLKDGSTLLSTHDAEDIQRRCKMFLPFTFWSSVFTLMLQIGVKYSEESIRVDALSIMILIVRTTDPKEERQKFEFCSVIEGLHRLLQRENGLLVKKHSVRLLFLLLNCPTMLRLLCSGGKDASGQMESEGSETDRSKKAISSVLENLSECLTCESACSLGIELCRLVIVLLAYIASSGKMGYEVLIGPVTSRGASFLELIMEVLASQMQYETLELLMERCLLMREALILLNRLASHTNFSKPTLEMLTSSKLCATLTIDVANRLPQTRMANDLAELAQKFRSRVYGFLEDKPLTADGSNPNASFKSHNFQEQKNSTVNHSIPR